jgi:plastocyanin
MRPRVAALVALAALAAPATAAGQTVQAVDGTAADGFNNRWTPAEVTVKSGETVTWSFAGTTGFHNVASDPDLSRGDSWSFRNGDPLVAPPPASHRFDRPGKYAFLCEIHGTTMVGTVTVTDAAGNPPPPPPPPPLSAQPWPNDQRPPSTLEALDHDRPRLTRVRAAATDRGARVRFRLSEAARVTIRVKRGRRTVRTRRASVRRGAHAVTVRGLSAGRYRVEVRARDLSGNRSRARAARLMIRR